MYVLDVFPRINSSITFHPWPLPSPWPWDPHSRGQAGNGGDASWLPWFWGHGTCPKMMGSVVYNIWYIYG